MKKYTSCTICTVCYYRRNTRPIHEKNKIKFSDCPKRTQYHPKTRFNIWEGGFIFYPKTPEARKKAVAGLPPTECLNGLAQSVLYCVSCKPRFCRFGIVRPPVADAGSSRERSAHDKRTENICRRQTMQVSGLPSFVEYLQSPNVLPRPPGTSVRQRKQAVPTRLQIAISAT